MAIDNLEKAFNHPDDTEARERMAEASLTAGLAFNLPKTNSAHACSYPLTNWLGIAHGEACAMTITHFMRYNAEHGDQRTETLARLVGFNDAHALADHLDGMRQRTGHDDEPNAIPSRHPTIGKARQRLQAPEPQKQPRGGERRFLAKNWLIN